MFYDEGNRLVYFYNMTIKLLKIEIACAAKQYKIFSYNELQKTKTQCDKGKRTSVFETVI